jgi:hypothetical protein
MIMENKQFNNINIIKTKGERHKKYKYRDERKALTKKILLILNVTNANKMFDSNDLDNNNEKKKAILDLIPEIEQYFSVSKWCFWRKESDKKHISLVKSLLKDMNIKFLSTNKKIKIKDHITMRSLYAIQSDISEYL